MANAIATQADDPDRQPLAWYRYGWPWFLISIPLVSICLGVLMLYLALSTNNSLVVDDYYKQGKAINQRIDRDRVAALLGLQGTLNTVSEGLLLNMQQRTPELPTALQEQAVTVSAAFSWPETLQLRWVHITEAELDGKALLQSIGGGRFIAPNVQMPGQGKFRLHLEPTEGSQWRLVSNVTTLAASSNLVISAPSPELIFRKVDFEP